MQDFVFAKPKLKKNNRFLKLAVAGFLILLFLGFLKRNLGMKNNLTVQKPKNNTVLLAQIKKETDSAGGNWSVYVFDLDNNQGFGINETTVYTAASVNKIPILAVLYSLAGKKEVNLDQQITLQASDIQDYGTGSIRYDPPGTTYSVKTLARLMMEQSDNTAAYILGRQVMDITSIQNTINDWGLTQTDMEGNKTSLLDMATILTKMYHGEITNKSLTTEMLGFMDNSDFEDRIPALLPKNIKVYHKIGDEVGDIHDVGLVDLTNHPYFIGVLTNDITEKTNAKQTIAQISKLVFDFMNN